ncbi:MAG TPA: YihY/virulence factor BrkB family protein [Chloroflexota bacterium]|nr:YihY/virulence factor BrkB family protein [Chloroflexota bacterium]
MSTAHVGRHKSEAADLGSSNQKGQGIRVPSRSELEADAVGDAKEALGTGKRAYAKFTNDWTMNLVSMLSYNVLTSIFPLLLALFTILALVPSLSGHTADFANQVNRILPGSVAKSINVTSLLAKVRASYGILTVISVAGLLWGGSNLFGTMENAFAIVYRVRTRDFIPQKLMSLVMILLFVVLLPLSFVSSILLGSASTTLGTVLPAGLSGPLPVILGLAASLGALFILFMAIYVIVPNMPISWRHAWRGAIVAAIVMALINTIFPFYTAHFIGTSQYGTAAIGTVIVMITWFWFFSLVLMIGAQVNALAMGLKPWPYDLARMLTQIRTADLQGAPKDHPASSPVAAKADGSGSATSAAP